MSKLSKSSAELTPAKLVPKPGEHRRPMIELVPAPAEGAPITPYPDDA